MMKPVNKLVYILPDAPMERNEKGIYLPPSSKKQTVGKVIASNSPMCKAGDRASYRGYVPHPEDDSLVIVDDRAITGVDDGTDVPFPIPTE